MTPQVSRLSVIHALGAGCLDFFANAFIPKPSSRSPIAETPATAIKAGFEAIINPVRSVSRRAEPHIESATPTSLPTVKSLPVRAFDIPEGSQRISWAARQSDVDYMVIARPARSDRGCKYSQPQTESALTHRLCMSGSELAPIVSCTTIWSLTLYAFGATTTDPLRLP